MNLKNIEITSRKIIELIFNLIIIVLFSNPLLLIIYTRFLGINLQNLIAMNPYWNILFIKSFITPFIGYYMIKLKEQSINEEEVKTIVLQLLFMTISLIIMDNTVFSISVFILIFYLFYQYKIKIKDVYHHVVNKKVIIKDWLVPTAFLSVAIIIRVMIILVSSG